MEIRLAAYAGFCFGVDRAVNMATEELKHEPLYSLGSIIHNESVMARLTEQGLVSVDSVDEMTEDRPVIIRSHGAGPEVYELLREKKCRIIDTTCPYVKRLHSLIRAHSEEGKDIFVLGDPGHPEVIGSIAWGNERTQVLKDLSAVELISPSDVPTVLLAQTTLTQAFWEKAESILKTRRANLQTLNTVCPATAERQEAAAKLAGEVDLMIVLGSKRSSNTRKLVEICMKYNKNVKHFENSDEINGNHIAGYGIIGVTAGASTPAWVIQDTVELLNNYGKEQH